MLEFVRRTSKGDNRTRQTCADCERRDVARRNTGAMRLPVALVLLALTAAASPPRQAQPPLPVPPIPPDNPPSSEAAPMPNLDIRGPIALDPQGAQLKLNFFQLRRFDQGMGYVPGSRFQSNDEKRGDVQNPGVMLRMPLQ